MTPKRWGYLALVSDTSSEAEHYLVSLNKRVGGVARLLHASLIARGCATYVKTIYIGYEIDGQMVAALYGHSDHVELALALPEEAEDDLLVDATHLTWRTLPVAAIVTTPRQADGAAALISAACDRVRAGSHDVNRDNEVFVRAREHRRRRGL